jgi:hypothetical protein
VFGGFLQKYQLKKAGVRKRVRFYLFFFIKALIGEKMSSKLNGRKIFLQERQVDAKMHRKVCL